MVGCRKEGLQSSAWDLLFLAARSDWILEKFADGVGAGRAARIRAWHIDAAATGVGWRAAGKAIVLIGQ